MLTYVTQANFICKFFLSKKLYINITGDYYFLKGEIMTKTNSVGMGHCYPLMPPYLITDDAKKKGYQPDLSTMLGGYWMQLDPNPNPIRTAFRKLEEKLSNEVKRFDIELKDQIPHPKFGKTILLDDSSEARLRPAPEKPIFKGKIIPREDFETGTFIEIPETGK